MIRDGDAIDRGMPLRHEPPSGLGRAVAANGRSERPGATRERRLEDANDLDRQRLGRRPAGRVGRADAELPHALGPVVLVVDLGDDDLWARASATSG